MIPMDNPQAVLDRIAELRLKCGGQPGVTAFDLLAQELNIRTAEALHLFTEAQRTIDQCPHCKGTGKKPKEE